MTDGLSGLPGEGLVRSGLADLEEGRDSAAATLVRLASRRFRELGFAVPGLEDGELRLYEQVAKEFSDRDPFAVYSAWLELLESFLAAARDRRRHEGALVARRS